MLVRRTFLKLAGAVSALGLVRYEEPLQAIPNERVGDWIEDRGDFYIVRVPRWKSFANEFLHKPTIFLLEEGSLISHIGVLGFVNLQSPHGATAIDLAIDASRCSVRRKRPILEVQNAVGLTMLGLTLRSHEDSNVGCWAEATDVHGEMVRFAIGTPRE